jgi:small-conductance mechanosensitive channel
MALSVLGFPLSNLTLMAGGLGVGIGFGLKDILNNFVSGLILLYERPVKVGDMLSVDQQWGRVKAIRVRSTVLETLDGNVMIIPNSQIISGKILNWTHDDSETNRLTLNVGVAYGSDVRKVTRILLDICHANPRVMQDPAPKCAFKSYGGSSLDFAIWVHLRTPADRIPATHELNTAILEEFQENGIEIPFPQQEIFVKNWPALSRPAEISHKPPHDQPDDSTWQ